ncbi:MAG: FRG domain-containing protein, partial [Gemmatimonadales bacterium]|nr:FRG domain-containing protein [Gemmatimonadales bacterium]
MYVTTGDALTFRLRMPIAEITVNSLGDLIDKVTPTEADPKTGRLRDSGVYRGDGNARWPLLTSLDKLGGAGSPHSKVDLEEHILRNFIRYSRPYFGTPPVNDWEV